MRIKKMIVYSGIVVVAALALWIGWGLYSTTATERPPYEVVRELMQDVEIRRYAAQTWIATDYLDDASSFRVLAGRCWRPAVPVAGLLAIVFSWRTTVTWMAYADGNANKLVAALLISSMLVARVLVVGYLVRTLRRGMGWFRSASQLGSHLPNTASLDRKRVLRRRQPHRLELPVRQRSPEPFGGGVYSWSSIQTSP